MYPEGQRIIVEQLAASPMEALQQSMQLVAQSAPDPDQLAAGDVIIAVKSASVGWVDLLMGSGQYQHMPPLPYTPGLEYSGEVLWCGSAVKNFKPGDAVLCDGFQTGPRSPGAYQQYGGFASYAVAPASALIRKPAALDFDQACNLLGAFETAYHCLVHCGKVQAGETVLIHGASGATGLAAVQIAKLLGATVIASGRSDSKLAQVKALGADHVVNCSDLDSFKKTVKTLSDGGVDVIYDTVGGELSQASLRCARFGARFLIVGWASTPDVAKGKGERGAPRANTLPTNLIMMKGLQVIGCPTVISSQKDPSIRPKRLQQILDWAESGQIKPYISQRCALAEYQAALGAKWRSEIIGAATLQP